MSRRRSARGETVDFDLLRIKEQIAAGPKPVNVQSREEFIDRKVRRRAKKQPVQQAYNPSNVDVDLLINNNVEEQQEMIDDNPYDENLESLSNADHEEQQSEQSSDDPQVRKIRKRR